ncbi:DegT/DnrJ/EryC1/StrS family aminotransferase [Tellurirhabdus bombi]|uniref:DegT/DnrJ/EryC1/StrS family aminotransferase n=1 Tax=Tellurirhabdus bombi TaxID=2907205 RepID=UPI001F1A0BBF|nr:DegT/DnrJ/EryC1/StrS family aminotransferase [Tellurirhabdus bombi]
MIAIEPIQMVDLKTQYHRLKSDIDEAIQQCLHQGDYINGHYVREFQQDLAHFLRVSRVVTCANGTDALQLALMGLGLKPGDEVIVPAFSYVATAEVIALLGLTPVWADVDPLTFNLTADQVERVITPRTKAVIPVHLFGQCVDMTPLLNLAKSNGLAVVEDTAQALGSEYRLSDGNLQAAGTLGDIGCTSFFPSKNLGCYGDGGALFTNQEALGERLRMIANHGQRQKYVHELVGVNSRLDTLQAAILTVKLKHLKEFSQQRQQAAARYDQGLQNIPGLQIPTQATYSTHVYHQYTLKVAAGLRDGLKAHLSKHGVPSMVYYPIPLHQQPAYQSSRYPKNSFPIAEALCQEVLSLPMHTELNSDVQGLICSLIGDYMTQQIKSA